MLLSLKSMPFASECEKDKSSRDKFK